MAKTEKEFNKNFKIFIFYLVTLLSSKFYGTTPFTN